MINLCYTLKYWGIKRIMKTIGNLCWLLFGGLFWGLGNILVGGLVCATIIGIPLGLQLIKMGCFVLWPFGKQVVATSKQGAVKLLVNIIWLILFGLVEAIGYLLTGLLLCITIIGIPFGKQYFKLAQFVLLPFGYDFK